MGRWMMVQRGGGCRKKRSFLIDVGKAFKTLFKRLCMKSGGYCFFDSNVYYTSAVPSTVEEPLKRIFCSYRERNYSLFCAGRAGFFFLAVILEGASPLNKKKKNNWPIINAKSYHIIYYFV